MTIDYAGPRAGAVLSEDGRYRYELWRTWDFGECVTFVMLNPSTADAFVDDPTIRRCVGFAKLWGFAAVRVLNLFAWRATDPAELLTIDDPIGVDNDAHLRRRAWSSTSPMVAAWGAHPLARERARQVDQAMYVRWSCLGTTVDGSPRHPLYVRKDAPLIEWSPPK